MAEQQNPLGPRLDAAAGALISDATLAGLSDADSSILRYLGYDDGNADTGFRVQVQIIRTGDSINAAFFRVPVTLTSTATAKFET